MIIACSSGNWRKTRVFNMFVLDHLDSFYEKQLNAAWGVSPADKQTEQVQWLNPVLGQQLWVSPAAPLLTWSPKHHLLATRSERINQTISSVFISILQKKKIIAIPWKITWVTINHRLRLKMDSHCPGSPNIICINLSIPELYMFLLLCRS